MATTAAVGFVYISAKIHRATVIHRKRKTCGQTARQRTQVAITAMSDFLTTDPAVSVALGLRMGVFSMGYAVWQTACQA
jgi:ElaB/YqjD/DUF883 family membrane-anchored ribosome-binding protein